MAHSSPLIHALDAADQNSSWTGVVGLALVSPNANIQTTQHAIIISQAANDNQSMDSLGTRETPSAVGRITLDKKVKPLKGPLNGVLLKGVNSSPAARFPSTIYFPNNTGRKICKITSTIQSQHTSVSQMDVLTIGTPITGSSSMESSKEQESPLSKDNDKRTGLAMKRNSVLTKLCPRCNNLCYDLKECEHCGTLMAQNTKIARTLNMDSPSATVLSGNVKCTTAEVVLAPKAFYTQKIQRISRAPLVRKSMDVNVQKRALKGLKRQIVNPPECLTLSSDDEGNDYANDTTALEIESPTKSDKDEPLENSNCIIPETDKSVTEPPEAHNILRAPSPKTGISFKVHDIFIPCRSIRIGSFKVASSLPLTIKADHFSFTIPTVGNSNEMVTLRIGLKDIVAALACFAKSMPVIIIYATPGLAAAIRTRLKMNNKSGPFYDPKSTDETQKRIIFLPESVSDNDRVTIKVIFKNHDRQLLNHPQEPTLKEIDSKNANELLVRSTPSEIVANVNKLIMPLSRKAKPVCASTPNDKMTTRKTPTVIPLEKTADNKNVKIILTYPPTQETGRITVTTEDVNCLVPGEFLNDVIIDFYLKYVFIEKLSEVDRKRTHIFNSFFYKRLTHAGMPSLQSIRSPQEVEDRSLPLPERRHRRVQTWTRNVDIFEKDFIIIPINESSHWFLAIICYPYLESCPLPDSPPESESQMENTGSSSDSSELTSENLPRLTGSPLDLRKKLEDDSPRPKRPCILLFDSLHSRNWSKVVVILREYLKIEWFHKKKTLREFEKEVMKGAYPIVPQQNNYSDCGIYLLQYVESFFENPIKDYTLPIRSLQSWFPVDVINNKRNFIKELILKRSQEQNSKLSGDDTVKNAEQSISASPGTCGPDLQRQVSSKTLVNSEVEEEPTEEEMDDGAMEKSEPMDFDESFELPDLPSQNTSDCTR